MTEGTSTLPETIAGDGVTLRLYQPEDVDEVLSGCSDPQTQRFLPMLPSPYTRDHALQWINERAPAANAAGDSLRAIADPASGRLLGGVGVHPRGEGTAELGYWMAPGARGQGVATAAARAMTTAAFAIGFERLYLRTELDNFASQRVAIAAGYTRESVQRAGGANRDGQGRHDLAVWVRLATDPDGPAPRLLPDLPGRRGPDLGHLSDGVVILRPLGSADADDTLALRNLPDVIATSVPPVARKRDDIVRNCAHAQAGWLAGNRADLTVRDAATGEYAGEIGLYYWEPPLQQAMIGYSMMPAWRGRGYATRAAVLLSDWAFEIGILRVVAGTEPSNVGSQRVLQRAGFVREGYSRVRLPGAGDARIDDVQWARISPRYPDAQAASQITP